MDCSLPGSSVHGICQARVLEWGAIAFSHLKSSLKVEDSIPSLPHITIGWRSQFLTVELFLGLFTTWQLISAEQGIPERERQKQKPLHLGSNILCPLQFLLQLAWVWLNFTSSGYSLVQGCPQLQTPDHLHFCSAGYKFEASYYPLKFNNSLQCFTELCKALYL